jgi:hypothetical protein
MGQSLMLEVYKLYYKALIELLSQPKLNQQLSST